MMVAGRVRSFLLVMVGAVAMLLAGCSAPEQESSGAPVQINLPDGRQVTIDGTPKRIVTLGGQWTDVALAFGVTPVGYYDASTALGSEMPVWYGDKLDDVPAIDPNGDMIATIASLEPDLIVAPGFASMAGNFDKLSKIAPTLDKISGQQIDPWQDMVTLMGTILHEPQKATEIIGKVNTTITDLTKEYPGIKGKTYAFAYMFGPDQIQAFGDANDGAGQLFSQLGLTIAPKLAAESKRTGQPRFPISAENLPWLESDLLIMAAQTPELRKRLESLPGYKNLSSVKSGAVSMMTQMQITALNEPSPNALIYAFDLMKPALAAAAKE